MRLMRGRAGMAKLGLGAAVCAMALSAHAQETPPEAIPGPQTEARQHATEAPGGVVRILDKLTGQIADRDLGRGQAVTEGRLTVLMDQCRYPSDNPSSDAFAHLTISDAQKGETPVFAGWMVASAPALSALDHPRYDVWVLHCDTPEGSRPVVQRAPDTGEDDPGTGDDDATEDGSGQ